MVSSLHEPSFMLSDAGEEVSTSEPVPVLQRFLTGGVLITAASGLAYMAVYSYDVGFCVYFRIPLSLIVISAPNLIAVAIVALFLMYATPVALSVLPPRFLRELGNDWWIIPAAAFLIVALIALFLQNISLLFKIFYIGSNLLFAVAGTMLLRMYYRRIGRSGSFATMFLTSYMSPRVASGIFGAALMGLLVVASATLFGQIAARTTYYYGLTDERDPKVLLAFFGNLAVAAAYDHAKHVVRPRFTVYEIGRTLPSFRYELTGRLKVAEICDVAAVSTGNPFSWTMLLSPGCPSIPRVVPKK